MVSCRWIGEEGHKSGVMASVRRSTGEPAAGRLPRGVFSSGPQRTGRPLRRRRFSLSLFLFPLFLFTFSEALFCYYAPFFNMLLPLLFFVINYYCYYILHLTIGISPFTTLNFTHGIN